MLDRPARSWHVTSGSLAVLLAAVSCASSPAPVLHANAPLPARPPVATSPAPATPTLQFSELFAEGAKLEPSPKALQSAGQRVRMVGFMAELENPPQGAFYLTPRPVHCDEAGAGTGDLPIESVLVSAPFLRDKRVPHIAGAIEVVGIFELGNRVALDGFASSFRLALADPTLPTKSGEQARVASDVSARGAEHP